MNTRTKLTLTWRNGYYSTPKKSSWPWPLSIAFPLAPVRDFKEVRNDESLADQFVPIERPDTGPVYFAGPPYRISSQIEIAPSPAPLLGQHNSHVYCEDLGYSREELVKLYQTGII